MVSSVIGYLIIIACVWLGFSAQRLFGLKLPSHERWALALGVGPPIGVWILYLASLPVGRLSWFTLIIFFGICLTVGLLAPRRRPKPDTLIPPGWFIATVVVTGVALIWMNFFGVFAPVEGGVAAVEHIWADGPYHASLVTNFASGAHLPPTYPIAPGEKLAYPFLVDFLTAAVTFAGASLRGSFIAVNLVLGIGIFSLIAAIAHRLTKSPTAAVLAVFIFFCLGNFGIISAIDDIRRADGIGNWISNLPWSYTGDSQGNKGRDRLGIGVYLGNPVFMFINPRRAGSFGMLAGSAAMLVLLELRKRPAFGIAVLAGLTLGMLPRIHTHTAIIVAIVAICWLVRKFNIHTALAACVAGLFALPQILSISTQTAGFISVNPGFIGEGRDAFSTGSPLLFVTFWVMNLGLLIVALPLGLSSSRLRSFVLPFGLVFLLANIFKTQPLEWDNSPYFHFIQLGFCIVAAYGISTLIARQPWNTFYLLRRGAAVLLVVGLTAGGFLSFIYASQQRFPLWSDDDVKLAAAVKQLTEPHDVIATAGISNNFHLHPVNALAGRQTFAGWGGWLFAHGLDWQRYTKETRRIYSGDIDLICRRVDFVLLSTFEQFYIQDQEINPDALLRSSTSIVSGTNFDLLKPDCP